VANAEYLTITRLSIKEITRLFSKIRIDAETGCWNWLGAKDGQGYGFFAVDHHQTRVHRIVYAWAIGPVPKGIAGRSLGQIDHLCRNTSCCNPIHLELVTPRTNVARGTSPIAIAMKKTHCPYGHELTVTRNKKRRECKTCDSDRHKARLRGPKGDRYREIGRRAMRRLYERRRNSQP
jgi:hypothetical protein